MYLGVLQDQGYSAHSLVHEFLQQPEQQQQRQQHGGILPTGYSLKPPQQAETSSSSSTMAPQPSSTVDTAAPEPPPTLLKLAVLLLGYGQSHAVEWAQKLLGVQPVDGRAITYLGELPRWAKEESATEFSCEPEGQLYTRAGLALQKAGRFSQAEELLKEALNIELQKLSPEHQRTADSRINLGSLYKNQGKFDIERLTPRWRQCRERLLFNVCFCWGCARHCCSATAAPLLHSCCC
jgi:tetratricopeptide (TPR) repeat protein